MKRALRLVCILSLVALCVVGAIVAAARTPGARAQEGVAPEPFPFSDRYPATVLLEAAQDMEKLLNLGIIVERVSTQDGGAPARPHEPFRTLVALVYVSPSEAARLEKEGLPARAIPNESLRAWRELGLDQPGGWPTYEEWGQRMQALATTYPDLVRMVSIGQSVQGRPIWMLKLTDNPDAEEDEPEFKWVSTMHGNEPVGAELILRLAELLTSSYGADPDLTALVDGMEIWLLPIFNPDGYMAGSRWNAHGVDLNRNFPDRNTDPIDDPAGREPETQAAMVFGYEHRTVMGANYHAGALVVNYPWDSVPVPPDYAPDDEIYYDYSVGYAIRNPMIYNGGFPNGVTRGWEWYIIRGGMQDWAYHWRGEHHVTIEVSNQQPPPYNQMDTYWAYNRDAMLWWMGRSLMGVRGLVTDAATGAPLDASVEILELGKPVRTDPDVGDYHRLLLPGSYTLRCSAAGYIEQTWPVEVTDGPATIQHCALTAESPPAVHVASIRLLYVEAGSGRYRILCRLKISDGEGQAVPGALVDAEWILPDGGSAMQQVTTDGQGSARFRMEGRLTGTFRLCVLSVSKAGFVYDPAQNVETCDALAIP